TTITCAVEPGIPGGIWKLICVAETKNKGTAAPLTSTCVPPSVVGRLVLAATAVAAARFVPNSETMEPGLTTASLEKLAPLTTPFCVIVGVPTTRLTAKTCGLFVAPDPCAAVIVTVPL